MILPSIDLMNGSAVQLVGGREKRIDAGDPIPIAQRFALAGEIAVVDLDAALGQGDNSRVIDSLLEIAPCRVGGGIRDLATAMRWLDAGATKIVLGTAAEPALLNQLPPDRVVVALDAVHGEVVTHGWRTPSGATIEQRIDELRGYVDEFLITFVEREGRMQGIDLPRVQNLLEYAQPARLTIAGGVRDITEIAALDRLGIAAQVGMALYTNAIHLADAITAPLTSDRPDGLWPTVVVDERGVALGLAYSNADSVRAAVDAFSGVYHSRSRGLWKKGDTSGASQKLLRLDLDCDRDTLRFTVRQRAPGFCHTKSRTCWGQDFGLGALERRLRTRRTDAPAGSYTARLFNDRALLSAKLCEEAAEFAATGSRGEVIHEAADVLYFLMTRLAADDVDLAEVERELDRRSMQITRRPGDATLAPTTTAERRA